MKVDSTNVQHTTEVLPFAKPMLGDVFPSGGIELVGYNVEYWVRSPKATFLAKGLIIAYKKQHKQGTLSYTGGVYTIKCGKRTFAKRRGEFTVVSKNIA
jgi:hypothetical protein